jgi:hypothetical protein
VTCTVLKYLKQMLIGVVALQRLRGVTVSTIALSASVSKQEAEWADDERNKRYSVPERSFECSAKK